VTGSYVRSEFTGVPGAVSTLISPYFTSDSYITIPCLSVTYFLSSPDIVLNISLVDTNETIHWTNSVFFLSISGVAIVHVPMNVTLRLEIQAQQLYFEPNDASFYSEARIMHVEVLEECPLQGMCSSLQWPNICQQYFAFNPVLYLLKKFNCL